MTDKKKTDNQHVDADKSPKGKLVFASDIDDFANDDADIDIDDEDVDLLLEEHKDADPDTYKKICAAKSSGDKSIWEQVLGAAKDYIVKAIKKKVGKTISGTTKSSSTKKTSSGKKTSTTAKTSSTAKKSGDMPAWVDLVKKFVSMCSTQDKKKVVSTARVGNLVDDISACLKKSKAKGELLNTIKSKLESRAKSDQRTQEMPMWADLVKDCRQAIESAK